MRFIGVLFCSVQINAALIWFNDVDLKRAWTEYCSWHICWEVRQPSSKHLLLFQNYCISVKRFASQRNFNVFKSSKTNFLHMFLMKCRCAWHIISWGPCPGDPEFGSFFSLTSYNYRHSALFPCEIAVIGGVYRSQHLPTLANTCGD